MKRIKLEKQIENIIYKNRIAGIATYYDGNNSLMILIKQENIKNISTQIKKLVYNSYRRRKPTMKAKWNVKKTI